MCKDVYSGLFCDSGWTQVEHQMTLHFSRLGKPCSAMEGWVGVCSDVDHALARGDCAEKEPREHLCESSNPRCTWKFHTKPGSDLIVENVAKTKIESVYQSVIHVMINFNLYGRHRMFQRMALPIKNRDILITDHWEWVFLTMVEPFKASITTGKQTMSFGDTDCWARAVLKMQPMRWMPWDAWVWILRDLICQQQEFFFQSDPNHP